jgi:MYXO-CTERM domain-containing protein
MFVRRVSVVALFLFAVPRAEAGCLTCTTSKSCSPGYVCAYDPSWEATCCTLAPDAGMGCEVSACMGPSDCERVGAGWTCEEGCCFPPRCNTSTCDVDSNCAELGPRYRCVGGCCADDPLVCTNVCGALLDCQFLGASWFCDTAAGCCVDVNGSPDAGSPECRLRCESLSGCSELGASWVCDTAVGCCVDVGLKPDAGPGCAQTCESIGGCRELGSSFICDTARGCCVDTTTSDAGTLPGTPRRTTGSANDRRPGCGCSAAGGGGVSLLLLALAALLRRARR